MSLEAKLKHLDFIQAAIARMAQNSLLVKGWSVTLTSALIALSAKDANAKFVYAPVPAILLFWWLNAFFLTMEHRFRRLYDDTIGKDEKQIDFKMDPAAHSKGKWETFSNLRAKTQWPFHGTLLACVLLFAHSLKADRASNSSEIKPPIPPAATPPAATPPAATPPAATPPAATPPAASEKR